MKIYILLFLCFILQFQFNANSQEYKLKCETQKPIKISLSETSKSQTNGIEVFGNVVLKNKDSFIEIFVIDDSGHKLLVQEFFYPLYEPGKYAITKCEDFDLINDLKIDRLGINCYNSNISLSSIKYYEKKPNEFITRNEQISDKIYTLNEKLKAKSYLWRASLNNALRKYVSRNIGNGKKVKSSYGFEFYEYGIFSATEPSDISISTLKTTSSFVDNFDWRYRHGAMQSNSPYYDNSNMDYASGQSIPNGWMTPIHCQFGNNGAPWDRCQLGCFAFAPINAIEAKFNLFYNQHLDYDLSEQDAIDCNVYNTQNRTCYNGGYISDILKKAKNDFIVNEDCFPYINDTTNCIGKCSTPTRKVTIENYSSDYSFTEDELKSYIINSGPMAGGSMDMLCV